MLHAGTNDIRRGQTIASTKRDLKKVIAQLRLANPGMVILIAQIIPVEGIDVKVRRLNSAISALAAETDTATSPVIVVDQYTGFDVATDLYDGLHPTESGYIKMADRWFSALNAVLDGSSPTTVTVTEPTNGSTFSTGADVVVRASVSGSAPIAT
ncbi:MAG: GDSL-type esterase/lipase family protein, partial [Acidimicrobiia bacterium]|nr:GDSL-type esterase/lipase family protein [Acidimicrobiia bacterium]